jgi:hypothetical protein
VSTFNIWSTKNSDTTNKATIVRLANTSRYAVSFGQETLFDTMIGKTFKAIFLAEDSTRTCTGVYDLTDGAGMMTVTVNTNVLNNDFIGGKIKIPDVGTFTIHEVSGLTLKVRGGETFTGAKEYQIYREAEIYSYGGPLFGFVEFGVAIDNYEDIDFAIEADGDYPLPDGFTQLLGPFAYPTSQGYPPMEIFGEGWILAHRSDQSQAAVGRPTAAAVSPVKNDGSTVQKYRLMTWPTSDSDYAMQYRYRIEPLTRSLRSGATYPAGGWEHTNTILTACLSMVESRKFDGGNGEQENKYKQFLAQSIERDREGEEDFSGYNYDRSDELRHGASVYELRQQSRTPLIYSGNS